MATPEPKAEPELVEERDRLRLLLDSSNALISHRELRGLFTEISNCLRRVFRHEMTGLALYDEEARQLKSYAIDFPTGKGFIEEEMIVPTDGTPAGIALREKRPVVRPMVNSPSFRRRSERRLRLKV